MPVPSDLTSSTRPPSVTSPRQIFSRWLPAYLLLTGLLAGFFLGVIAVPAPNVPSGPPDARPKPTAPTSSPVPVGVARSLEGVDFELFWETWDYLKEHTVHDDLTDRQLFYGALGGLVESLDDPYSAFLEPTTSAQFRQDLSGSFEGIGAEIGIRKDRLTIIAPLPGNPAEKAGLKAGDTVLAIDGVSTAPLSLEESVRRIRGPRGTSVSLTVLHNGDDEPREVTITRATIAIVSVSWQLLDSRIAHLQLKAFNEDTLKRFREAAYQIVQANPRGIILDLRNNPGGFLVTAIEVTSYWTGADRPVVYERQRRQEPEGHKPTNRQALFESIPTVVLINKGSASGSEIVAGALQDFQLATLVGEASFGKGSVQDLHELQDGSAVKLTVAKWLTPDGREIEGKGITPDVAVAPGESEDAAVDPQLDKAIELLVKPASTP